MATCSSRRCWWACRSSASSRCWPAAPCGSCALALARAAWPARHAPARPLPDRLRVHDGIVGIPLALLLGALYGSLVYLSHIVIALWLGPSAAARRRVPRPSRACCRRWPSGCSFSISRPPSPASPPSSLLPVLVLGTGSLVLALLQRPLVSVPVPPPVPPPLSEDVLKPRNIPHKESSHALHQHPVHPVGDRRRHPAQPLLLLPEGLGARLDVRRLHLAVEPRRHEAAQRAAHAHRRCPHPRRQGRAAARAPTSSKPTTSPAATSSTSSRR